MVVNNPVTARTPAQVVFLHALESAGLSAVITILVAVVQYLSTSGFNLIGLGTVLGTAFLAQMAMLYKSLMANPQTVQAIADTEKQVEEALPQALQPVIHVDVAELAAQLKSELLKASQTQPQPAVKADIAQQQTRPVEVARANTPPSRAG